MAPAASLLAHMRNLLKKLLAETDYPGGYR